eukprot:1381477-Pleurochrysis_carterae.AAC.3
MSHLTKRRDIYSTHHSLPRLYPVHAQNSYPFPLVRCAATAATAFAKKESTCTVSKERVGCKEYCTSMLLCSHELSTSAY